jgi:hypothetical protein
MGTDIATGASGPTPDAVQPSPRDSGLAGITPRTPVASGPADSGPLVGGVMPTVSMFGEQAAAGTADCAAAQATAMDARNAMLAHYQAQALPMGGQIGDALPVPLVPDAAEPATDTDLYPYAGQEPTPAGVGFYHGDQPTLPE